MTTTKKLKVDPFAKRIDGNAWAILGAHRKQALAEGWTEAEIAEVHERAKDGDYDHLLQTLMETVE